MDCEKETRSCLGAHRHAIRWLVFVLATSFVSLALGAPPKPMGRGKRRPTASGSVSSDASASAPDGATSVTALEPSSNASAGSVDTKPRSPLTPRRDELAPPTAASLRTGTTYEQLMAEIAALRARVAVVGNTVWTSRLVVSLKARGQHTKLVKARLSLDGAPVWAAPPGLGTDEEVTALDFGVAAGPHTLTLEIERSDDRDDRFRTVDRSTTTVIVPQGKRVSVRARFEDESSLGRDFPVEQGGAYGFRMHFDTRVSK